MQKQNPGGRQHQKRQPTQGPSIRDLLALATPELNEFSSLIQAAYRLMPNFVGQKVPGTSIQSAILDRVFNEQMHTMITRASELLKLILSSSQQS